MTHHEALERSRRALDHREDCHHQLEENEPDPRLPGCRLWVCPRCMLVLSIDHTGVIRDTLPLNVAEYFQPKAKP